MYNSGADVVIEPYNNLKKSVDLELIKSVEEDSIFNYSEPATYIEPPYEQYLKIDGYESITKVLVDKMASLSSSRDKIRNIKVMGITPSEFGKTAWFRSDLLKPYHLNDYLNILTKAPKAVLLSSSIRDEYKIREGDTVSITLKNSGTLDFTVYGLLHFLLQFKPICSMKKIYFAVLTTAIVIKSCCFPYNYGLKETGCMTRIKRLYINLKVAGLIMPHRKYKEKNDPRFWNNEF